MSQTARPYFYQFSPLLIVELRYVLAKCNARRLDAKAAFRAWQKALDQEIEDKGFHDSAVENHRGAVFLDHHTLRFRKTSVWKYWKSHGKLSSGLVLW